MPTLHCCEAEGSQLFLARSVAGNLTGLLLFHLCISFFATPTLGISWNFGGWGGGELYALQIETLDDVEQL